MPWQGRDIGQFQQGHGGHLTLVDEALEDPRREIGEPQLSADMAFGKPHGFRQIGDCIELASLHAPPPAPTPVWQVFLGQHNLDASMSRRGNCHDNAVAESFFQLLKRERIRRRTYLTCEAARQDVFDYIETFCNPKRKHTNNGMVSPVDFEIRQQKLNEAGV